VKSHKPYNPLEKKNLGDSIASELLSQIPAPLPPPERFKGAGIYAIYYIGNYETYLPIMRANSDDLWALPIYVGKATPKGGRKGARGIDEPSGPVLYNRLYEHAKSIREVENLELEHFFCRFLVVDETFISLGEALMIQRFRPLWNMIVDGFGNHDPGGGRKDSLRSLCDTIHPGRSWASKYRERVYDETIFKSIDQHLVPPVE
jgi:hypothetical protein